MACSIHKLIDGKNLNYFDLKTFLEKDSTSVNDLDYKLDFTPIHRLLMSDKCSMEMVTLLLQYGANVNIMSRLGNALSLAIIYRRDKGTIQVLLEAGADVDVIDGYYNMTSLCMALHFGACAEVIKMLLESNCSLDNSREFPSMLHCAAFFHLKADVCKLLLQAGAGDVNELDRYGASVLCYALRKDSELEAIDMLMEAGCSLTACMLHQSAWLCATSYSSMLQGKILQVLCKAGININTVNDLNETPLQCALRYCLYDISAIKLLFKLQVGKVAKSRRDKSLLLDATSNFSCKLSTIKFLLEQQVEVNVTNDSGENALHVSLAYNCSPDIIQCLLEIGVDVNLKNNQDNTPLEVAVAEVRKLNILELLLKGGAHIHTPDRLPIRKLRDILKEYSSTPYFQEARDEIIKLFLKYTFLEKLNFVIERFDLIYLNYDSFVNFAAECVHELQDMKLKRLDDNRTLHELINRDFPSRMDIDTSYDPINSYDFNRFLEILQNNNYPVYYDVICSNIGRQALLNHLSSVKIFTYKSSSDFPCVQSKVILSYDCVRKIVGLLSEIDFLSLMIAYFIPMVSSN